MKFSRILKRAVSVVSAAALTVGFAGMSFAFAADTTVNELSANEPTDNNWSGSYTSKAETLWTRYWTYEHDYTELLDNSAPCDANLSLSADPVAVGDSRIYISPEWGGGFLAENSVNNYNGDTLYSYCYHEVGEHTSTLKIVNPNATDSQITSYFNNQVSKGNIQKLTVAFWDSGKNFADNGSQYGDWDYDHIVVNRSAAYTDSDLPSVHAGELLSELDGLVNFVPDGTYTWTDLCSMCDVIICPYGLSSAQAVWCDYYSMEYLAFDGYDPRGDLYYRFSDYSYDNYSLTKTEAFAIMYGDSLHKIESCEGLYRSVMCQLGKMDVDGTVIIGSDICYGHEYEAQNYSIDSSGTEGSNGVISLKCKYCGDTETIRGCSTSLISSVSPTCTQDGTSTYSVSGTYYWNTISGNNSSQSFSGDITVTVPAAGHRYVSAGSETGLQPSVLSDDADSMRQAVVKAASDHLGDKYVVGGRGYKMWSQGVNNTGTWPVFDCSGLTQYVYLNALKDKYGISVSFNGSDGGWDVASQWNFDYGYAIDATGSIDSFIARLEPGDLIFFNEQADGTPGHVGIYIGNGQMIDANSNADIMSVVTENLYTDRDWSSFMGARRIIFGIGETYPATMDLQCADCGNRITVDATAEIAGGTSATCGHSGEYGIAVTAVYNGSTYDDKVHALTSAGIGHDWDYNHIQYFYEDPRAGAYAVVTCKLCGEAMTEYCQTSYTTQKLSYNPATGQYEYSYVLLSATFVGEDGNEYTYELNVTDNYNAIESEHIWVPVEGTEVLPTCTEDGYCEYVCEDCGAVQTVISEATGHEYGPEFKWSEDYTECMVDFICQKCGEVVESVQTYISSVTNEDGTAYTAAAVWNGETYTDEVFAAAETQGQATEPESGTDNDDNGEDSEDNGTDTIHNTDSNGTVSDINSGTDNGGNIYGSVGSENNRSETDSESAAGSVSKASESDNTATVSQQAVSVQEPASTGGAKTDGDLFWISLIVDVLALCGIIVTATVRKKKSA